MNKARIRKIVFTIIGLVSFWMAGDWTYARWVVNQLAENEKHIERDATGLRKGCESFTVGSGDTAILMIHGFADSPAIFRPMASLLAQDGYTCRAMRLPGAGMPVDNARYVTRQMWEDAIYVEVRKLLKTHSQVWLLGHSLGGGLATRVAAQHPDEIAGAVLLAPLFEVSSRRSPLLTARQWFTMASRMLLFSDVFEITFSRDVKDASALDIDRRDQFIPFNIYQELFGLVDSLRQIAPQIQRPLMVVVSNDDRVVDSNAARHFFQACASTKKLLVEAKEAGHVIPIDRGWQATAQSIEHFIQQGHSEEITKNKSEEIPASLPNV
jgi:carboxylesterase